MRKSSFIFFVSFLLSGCSSDKNNQLFLSGTLESIESTISSKVTSEVLEIFVEEGAKISVGDMLCFLDPKDYEILLKQANANVKAAEAQYLLLRKGSRSEDIKQAEESLNQADATLKNAESDFERVRNLFETGGVSQQQKDEAYTKYLIVQAQYNSAKQLLEKLIAGSRFEEIEIAKARFEQACAQEEAAKKKVDDCIVISQINGYVTKRLVEKAELVNAGSPLFRISNLDDMYIMVYLPETKVGMVNLGDEAKITIDTFSEKEFVGKVIYISPEAEFTPKNIQTKEERVKLVFGVKIKIPNPQYILKAGLPADVSIKLKDSE